MTLFDKAVPANSPEVATDEHARYLARAMAKLLGKPSAGSMAFVRCMPRSIVIDLCRNSRFEIAGWDIFGVIGERDESRRLITAGRAVELRENKRGCVLLLVDVTTAGPGMDG